MLAVWWNASSLKSSPFPSGCTSRGRDQIGSPTGMRERATGVGTELCTTTRATQRRTSTVTPRSNAPRPGARSRASGPVAQRLASELRALVRSTPFCYVWYFCIWLSHALCRRLYSIFCPPKKVLGNMFARSHERTSRPERPRTSKTFLVTLSPLPVFPRTTQKPPRPLTTTIALECAHSVL